MYSATDLKAILDSLANSSSLTLELRTIERDVSDYDSSTTNAQVHPVAVAKYLF